MTKSVDQLASDSDELFQDAACGLARLREDGTFLCVNRRLSAWSGHPVDALVGSRRFQDLLTIGDRIFYQTHWSPLLQMQGSVSEVKFEMVTASGTRVPIIANAIRHIEKATRVVDVAVYIARDRDAYERELVATHRRLEAAITEAAELHARARTRATFAEQMVGIVSHDLRNPLSAIRMGATLLGQAVLDKQKEKAVIDRIVRAVDRSNALIGDLLDFTQARIGAGIPVRRAAIALHRTIADAVDELRLTHPDRTLLHETKGSGECEADRERLAQVVGNLVSNACAYGRRGGPIRITSTIEGETFSVAVHNDGTPIPTELQATIFEPLVRGSEVGQSGRSIGLGLFIVDQVARAHGGAAFVRSSEEEGTTFGVVVPCSSSQAPNGFDSRPAGGPLE